MEIRIERGELKETRTHKPYTKIQGSDGNWYNVMGDLMGLIGRTISIDPKPFGQGMWAQEFTVMQGRGEPITTSAPTPTTGYQGASTKMSFSQTVDTVLYLHRRLKQEILDDHARASAVNEIMVLIDKGVTAVPVEEDISYELPDELPVEDDVPIEDDRIPF